MAINTITKQKKIHSGFFSHKQKENGKDPLEHYRGEKLAYTPMMNLLAYKAITDDPEHFLALKEKEDGYADLLNIRGLGVGTMAQREANIVLDDFYHFLQAALSDMKFIICPFPVDTTEQKIYWGKRYNRTNIAISQETDPRRKHQLMTQLKYIHQTQRRNMLVENQLISEDFFLLLFGKTKTILRNNRNAAMNWGGSALFLEPLSKKRKEEVLTRINNLNTQR